MAELKELTCIGCPMGCPLQLTSEGNELKEVEGQGCNRGAKYAKQEFTDPRRGMSTTVAISGGMWKRLPVKVAKPVPKDRVLEAATIIHGVKLKAPVKIGQVILDDLLGEGISVVASRSMPKVAE